METTSPVISAACRVCGASEARTVLTGTDHREGMGGEFSVVACVGCGLARVQPWPERPMDWYPTAYQQHTEQTVTGRAVEAAIRRTATRPMPAVLRRAAAAVVPDADMGGPLAPGATLLDVGAGNGTAVRALRAAGVDAHGIEPASSAVAAARAGGAETVVEGRSRTTRWPTGRGTSSASTRRSSTCPTRSRRSRRPARSWRPGGGS